MRLPTATQPAPVPTAIATMLALLFLLAATLVTGWVSPAAAMMGDGTTTATTGPMMGGGTTTTTGPMMGGGGTTMTTGPMMGGGGTTATTGPMMGGGGPMFNDMAPDDWYRPYAEHMAENGFMMGYAGGGFGGYDPITRAQFAMVMARMMGLEPADGTTFPDLQGHMAAGMIEAMVDQGLLHGFADGTFHPDQTITRAQMAAIMDRAWQSLHGGTTLTDEELAQIREQMHDIAGTWAETHIAHMYGLGVIQGDQSGQFHPWDMTTRAQAGAMMWRWYELSQTS